MYLSSGPGSELYIGGVNTLKYTGTITYLPLESETEWVFKGSAKVNGLEGYEGDMEIDSGASVILGPYETVENWWSKVTGSEPCPVEVCESPGWFTYPCDLTPHVSFHFGGREFSVVPEEFCGE